MLEPYKKGGSPNPKTLGTIYGFICFSVYSKNPTTFVHSSCIYLSRGHLCLCERAWRGGSGSSARGVWHNRLTQWTSAGRPCSTKQPWRHNQTYPFNLHAKYNVEAPLNPGKTMSPSTLSQGRTLQTWKDIKGFQNLLSAHDVVFFFCA